jgi:hypothetical protein
MVAIAWGYPAVFIMHVVTVHLSKETTNNRGPHALTGEFSAPADCHGVLGDLGVQARTGFPG